MKTIPHALVAAAFRHRSAPGLIVAALIAGSGMAQAKICTWSGGSGSSGAWDSTANWSGGAYPINGDDVVFPLTASRKVNTNVFTKLRLNSITFSGAGYEIRGNAIILSDGVDSTAVGSVNTIDLNIDLGASQTFDCSSGTAALYLNGELDLGSYTLTMMGPGAVRITGVISGTGGMTKTGTGTHWLQGASANTYTGPTLVGQGTLMLAKPGGNSVLYGELTVGNGVGSADTAIVRELGDFQIGTIPVTINSDGWLDVDNDDDTVGAITFNGGHAGASGTGTLKLGGDVTVNAFSSTATLDGQVELAQATRTFDVANGTASPDLQVTAAVTGSRDLVKTGTGTLWLSGAGTYTGETTIDQGVVHVYHGSAFGDTAHGTTVTGTGSIQLNDVAVGNEGLTLDRPAASGTALSASGTSSWAGPVTLDTGVRISTGGYLTFTGAIGGTGGFTKAGTGRMTLGGTSANTYLGTTRVVAGRLSLSTLGGAINHGELIVGEEAGGDPANVLQTSDQVGDIPVTVNSSGTWILDDYTTDTIGALTLNGGSVTLDGTLTLGGDLTVLNNPDHPAQIGAGIGALLLAANRTFDIAATPFYPDLVVSAPMVGPGGFTKTGSGVLALRHANSYSGDTIVSQGQVNVEDAAAFGDTTGGTTVNGSGSIQLISTVVGNEPLALDKPEANGHALTASGLSGWAGDLTLNEQVGISTGGTLEFSGAIGGAGGIAFNGYGDYIFSGSDYNTYAGDTVLKAGTLYLGKSSGNAIQHGSLTIGDGSGTNDSVMVMETDDYQIGMIPVAVNQDGWLNLDDYYDTVGDITLHGGRISSSASGTLALGGDVSVSLGGSYISGNMSLGSALRTFDVSESLGMPIGNAHLDIDADVSGSGGMVKTGGGAMSLSGINTFGGTVTVEAGELLPRSVSALGSTSAGTVVQADAGIWLYPPPFSTAIHVGDEPLLLRGVLLAVGTRGTNEWGGPITLDGTATVSVATDCILDLPGAIGGSGSMVKDRSGSLILSGSVANTYSGDTRVDEGVLELAKSAVGGGAIAGGLFIGDGIGGADADVVRLKIGGQIDSDARVTLAESGLFDLDGRPAAVGSLDGSGHVSLGSGDLSTGMDDSSTIFSGVIDGSGDLEKWGSGTFTLDGSNTYSGTTRIGTGTLLINGWQPSSDVYVWEPGRLGGIGTVGAIDCIGSVAPGTSVGHLSCSGVNLASGLGHSMFDVELEGYTPAGYDRLDVGGTVTISGADLEVTWGFVPAVGDSFTIIDNDGGEPVVGIFNGLPDGASLTADNVVLKITYNGGDGNDVVLAAAEVTALEDLRFRSIGRSGGDAVLQWAGGVPFYQVNRKVDMGTNTLWQPVGPATRDVEAPVPLNTDEGYYQVIDGN